VQLDSTTLLPALQQLDGHKFRPADLATLSVVGGADILRIARYLLPKKADAEVAVLLTEARAQGVEETDIALVAAELDLAMGRIDAARVSLLKARASAPRDGRPLMLLATVEQQAGRPRQALAYAREATMRAPGEPDTARLRVELVTQLREWPELEPALQALRTSLRGRGASLADVHLLAGRAAEIRENHARAVSEYRSALAIEPSRVDIWLAVARLTEAQADLNGAMEAYQRLTALQPENDGFKQAVERLRKARDAARLEQFLR
jgi:tetratricopeptide (TPR) repeat protein